MSFCHKTSLLGIVESFLSVYLALLSLPVSVSVPETGRIDVCIRTHRCNAMQCHHTLILLLRDFFVAPL